MFRRLPRTIAMATSTAAHPFSSAAHPSPAAYSVAAAPVAASTAATVTADGDSPSHGNGALPRRMPIPPCGVDYRGKVVLAPMVRSGELPTRILALRYGADLVWGPETVDRSLIGTTARLNEATGVVEFTRPSGNHQGTPRQKQAVHEVEGPSDDATATASRPSRTDDPDPIKESLIFSLSPSPHHESSRSKLIFQLGTASPETAVAAARLVAPYVAGIDVNAGCPKPFSTKGGMGAALLRDPDRLCSILSALVAAVSPPPEQGGFGIGVSVKIRILETIDETRALVERLVATGITGLTVHCRTPPMRPREKAIREDGRLRVVAEVCRAAGVACLVNGDVASREEGELLAREHGVDGAMIAAAAERNPSCFRTAAQGGLASWEEIVRQYLRVAIDTRNRWGNTKFMMQQLVPGKQAVAKGILACKTYTHLVAALGPDVLVTASADGDVTATTMEEWEALAAQADVDLGLDERERLEREAREAKEARIRANSGGGKKAKVGVVKGQDNASAMAAAGSMAEARAADADKSRGKKRSQLSERRVSAVLAAGHEGDERDLEKLSRQHERMVERESAAAVAG